MQQKPCVMLLLSLLFGCKMVSVDCVADDLTCSPAWFLLRGVTAGATALQSGLADSGQPLCYNAAASQPCGDSSFPGQDGDYANVPRARSFTGPTAHATFTTDYTTYFALTAQTWKTCAEGTSGATCGSGAPTDNLNYAAGATLCSNLNAANLGLGYAGLTNWRLPTYLEFMSITNYSTTSPALDSGAFPNNSTSYVWASTAVAGSPGSHWQYGWVGFTYITGDGDTSGGNNTWCIASNAPLTYGPYTDKGDGTVLDQATLLVWQKCTSGFTNPLTCTGGASATKTWQVALQYCDALSLGNSASKWRLPSQPELLSILNTSNSNPATTTASFPNTALGSYWSSTTVADNALSAWVVSFTAGNALTGTGKGTAQNVRCVTGP